MSRIARLTPADLDSVQAALYESIAGGPRASGRQHFALAAPDGSLNGPFNAMLHAPGVGDALQRLGAAVRYGTGLSDRVREAAILLVAARWQCDFEVHAHAPAALAAGWSTTDAAILAEGGLPPTPSEQEAAALRAVADLLDGDLDDAEWAAARQQLDQRTLVELTTLVGYYAALALQLRVLRIGVETPPAS